MFGLALIAGLVLMTPWDRMASVALAQTPNTSVTDDVPSTADSETATDAPDGIWQILTAGGPIGVLIMLLSIGAVALIVEHVMTIREPVLMPPDLADQVRGMLTKGQIGPARQLCRDTPSLLSFVFEAGMSEVDGGWPAVEKALEDATADQSARLFRKIEYLSVIGNIAPMLGLLGTVVGMIFAFREVATTQGAARAADLANGIYLALVSTVEGLIVAIPSLAAFAVFRNRVDQLVAEATYVTQHVFAPLKRLRVGQPSGIARRTMTPTSPPASPIPPTPPMPPTGDT